MHRLLVFLFLPCRRPPSSPLFPYTTLFRSVRAIQRGLHLGLGLHPPAVNGIAVPLEGAHNQDLILRDRKSTRLNSSHSSNSYAVFCLKKNTPRSRIAG